MKRPRNIQLKSGNTFSSCENVISIDSTLKLFIYELYKTIVVSSGKSQSTQKKPKCD